MAGSRAERPTFGMIVFHADEPAMLRRCVEHHLALGVDHVLISLNVDDAESAAVAAAFVSPVVRVARLEDYTSDPLGYFDAALRAFNAAAETDWVMFVDSDEFWVPAGETLRTVAGLDLEDVYSVRRFNAPPIRDVSGAIRPSDLSVTAALVVVGRQKMDREYLARNPATPWISGRIGPRLMIRPRCVAHISFGAHEFTPAHSGVRVTIPEDLLIVHFPFSNEVRFRRKVDRVRAMLADHHHRLRGDQAWHWKRWLEVADAGGLSEEFAAQVVDERDVDDYISRGVLTTPEQLFKTGGLIDM